MTAAYNRLYSANPRVYTEQQMEKILAALDAHPCGYGAESVVLADHLSKYPVGVMAPDMATAVAHYIGQMYRVTSVTIYIDGHIDVKGFVNDDEPVSVRVTFW